MTSKRRRVQIDVPIEDVVHASHGSPSGASGQRRQHSFSTAPPAYTTFSRSSQPRSLNAFGGSFGGEPVRSRCWTAAPVDKEELSAVRPLGTPACAQGSQGQQRRASFPRPRLLAAIFRSRRRHISPGESHLLAVRQHRVAQRPRRLAQKVPGQEIQAVAPALVIALLPEDARAGQGTQELAEGGRIESESVARFAKDTAEPRPSCSTTSASRSCAAIYMAWLRRVSVSSCTTVAAVESDGSS